LRKHCPRIHDYQIAPNTPCLLIIKQPPEHIFADFGLIPKNLNQQSVRPPDYQDCCMAKKAFM